MEWQIAFGIFGGYCLIVMFRDFVAWLNRPEAQKEQERQARRQWEEQTKEYHRRWDERLKQFGTPEENMRKAWTKPDEQQD